MEAKNLRKGLLQMAVNARLGLYLEDDECGARVVKVEDFSVIVGASIEKDDVILSINGMDARHRWRELLKGGAPNSPFCLQYRTRANKELRTCTIFKQMVETLKTESTQSASEKARLQL